MKKEKKNLDYDRLLDDWGEEIYRMADEHGLKRDKHEGELFSLATTKECMMPI